MLPGEALEFGQLHKVLDEEHIERARNRISRNRISYILINSKITPARNWDSSVLDIKANESNIVGSESSRGKKSKNLALVLLQDSGPKQKKEGYVNLVHSEGPKRSLAL